MAAGEIEPRAVLDALGVRREGRAEPVRGGFDTAIWRIELGGEVAALRLFRPEQGPSFRRELAALAAARDGGLPVPAVRSDGEYRGRPAMLLSWCPGRPLLAELRARPWRAWPLGLAFGRMQAAIHALPAPADLQASGDWVDWAGPVDAALRGRLPAGPQPARLLHLDYHPLNVLVDGRRVTAVLDWVNCRAGDPRADVARTFTILRLLPVRPGPLLPPERALRLLLALAWRRGYVTAAGPPEDMAPFLAWAGEAMLRDLGRTIGRPGHWWQPRHFARLRR